MDKKARVPKGLNIEPKKKTNYLKTMWHDAMFAKYTKHKAEIAYLQFKRDLKSGSANTRYNSPTDLMDFNRLSNTIGFVTVAIDKSARHPSSNSLKQSE